MQKDVRDCRLGIAHCLSAEPGRNYSCKFFNAPMPVPTAASLPAVLDSFLNQLFIVAGSDIVFLADVFLQASTLAQHDRRMQSPWLGEDIRIFHSDVIVDLILVHTCVAFYDM